MTFTSPVFPSLARAVATRSQRLALPISWRSHPELARFRLVSDVLEAASPPLPPAARRPVLASLLDLAEHDAFATEVFLAALVPALRAVSSELARTSRAPAEEVDAAMAAGACLAVKALAGRACSWPDRAVVGRARDYARTELARLVRQRRREPLFAQPSERAGVLEDSCPSMAQDIVLRAVASGRLARRSAAIVWELRVNGRGVGDLAAETGRSAEAISMERLRGERALRAEVA